MQQEVFTQMCDYVLVDFVRGSRYRLTLMNIGNHPNPTVHDRPALYAIRRVYAKCDYEQICHTNDGNVLNGPFNVTFTLNKKDEAVLKKLDRVYIGMKGLK